MQPGPLTGVRIADFTHWQAGPSSTLLMAFLGAEVIKVETLTHLDQYRKLQAPASGELDKPYDRASAFQEWNAGKLSVSVNLKQPAGVEQAKKLLALCDAMVYNIRQATMDRLGLDYASVARVNPALIAISISNSGATGPERDYFGYAPTFAALGGVSHLSGYPNMPPCEHTGWPDTVVGTWATFALLAGLHERRRTGAGMFVDFSGREALTWFTGETLLDYAMNGRVRGRQGNHDEQLVPNNCYRCKGEEKWIAIAVATDEEWRSLCTVLGDPALSDDARFASAAGRREHQDELDRCLERRTVAYDDVELAEKLQAAGVAAVPSYSNVQLNESEHLQERGFFRAVTHPVSGWRRMAGPPWRFSASPADIPGPAPLLGQHDGYVHGELLGLSADEIERLRAEGVFY